MRNFDHLLHLNAAGEDYISDLQEDLNAGDITEQEFNKKLGEWDELFKGRVEEVMNTCYNIDVK
jgi:hypothetical protein